MGVVHGKVRHISLSSSAFLLCFRFFFSTKKGVFSPTALYYPLLHQHWARWPSKQTQTRSNSSYLTSVAWTQPINSNQTLTFWMVTKAFSGKERPGLGQLQLDNCSITSMKSMTRLMNRAVKNLAPTLTKAKRTKLAMCAHSVDVTKLFRGSCASMPTYIFTMGRNPTSVRSLAVEKPSARSKIFVFTWGSMSMRGLSSAHKAVGRASGPRGTCGTTNVATLETSKFIFSLSRLRIWGFLKLLCELWLIIILAQIRNYHTKSVSLIMLLTTHDSKTARTARFVAES